MSQNKNIFNDVSAPHVRKSSFDLSDTHVTSMNFGECCPLYTKATLPGSYWSMSSEWLVKTSAMLAPVMHKNQVYVHTFYVPYRILWEQWTDFITETKTAGVLPAVPFIKLKVADGEPNSVSRLANYLGVPFPGTVPGASEDRSVQAFWFAAYLKIWNEYYRDQNLQVELDEWELIDGDNTANAAELLKLRLRDWMHDYFTSALPDTQKGDSVNIPMTFGDVPVILAADVPETSLQSLRNKATGVVEVGGNVQSHNPGGQLQLNQSGTEVPVYYDPGDTLKADTSQLLGSATIIDLRTAEQLQKFRETMMTHGSRYNEFLQAIYGYQIHDATIQRPIYLGGMRADLMISETLNTAGNEGMNIPQGGKSGNANSYGNGGHIGYKCPEHGVIMSIMSVMPDSMYFQGIPKEMLKLSDPFEFGNPLMANIGEQPILNEELYAFQSGGVGDDTFGYQMRYAEYKQSFNRISGDMATTLLFWNEARNFAAMPTLNSDFVECNHANDDLGRIFNVEDAATQKLWVMLRTNAHVSQPLPYFGTPMLGG